MTKRLNMRRMAQAREAREAWEQAIAAGRDHAFINAKWEVYRSLAGDNLNWLEREAAGV